MAKIDSDNSGDIDFEEFLAFLGVGGDGGATSDKQSLVTRSLPIKPVEQVSWCLSRMAERKNLTFAMVCVNKLFTSLTPMQLINAGVMLELWGIVTEYNNIDKGETRVGHTEFSIIIAHS